jgi:hypothetical protein
MITNLDRANWAAKAILASASRECDYGDSLGDLLGDLSALGRCPKLRFRCCA